MLQKLFFSGIAIFSMIFAVRPVFAQNYKPFPEPVLRGKAYVSNPPGISASRFSPSFAYTRMGFWCRKEWRFEKKSGIPLRIRAGGLEQMNWLEQKPNRGFIPPSF